MPKKGVFKTIEQYEAEATRKPGGCLILKQTGDGLARKVYKLRHGPVPDSLKVCHTCDIPRCIEDSHHWLGTQKQNVQDASRKGRMKRSEEFRLRVGESKRGNTYGKANRGKSSNKGIPKSEKHKRALSKAHIIRSEFFRLMLQNNH